MWEWFKGLTIKQQIAAGVLVVAGGVALIFGGFEIPTPWGPIKPTAPIISISISAQELSSISTLSAYQANLRDRENLFASLRNSLAPVLLLNKVKSDLDLCAADAKKPSGPQLEFCDPITIKGLQDFSKFVSTQQKELDELAIAKDRGIAAKAKMFADELDNEKSKYGTVSYYYLLRAGVESLVSFEDEAILPFLFEGLGRLPKDSSMNSVLGRFLAFSGREGSVHAAIYFLEESIRHLSRTERHILKYKLSKSDECPLARYEKGEEVMSNAVAWLMALQGDITERQAAEVHVQRAIDLNKKLTDEYQKIRNCVSPPSNESRIAYKDTKAYVLLRFGQKQDEFKEAYAILKEAADEAKDNDLWETEVLIRHHREEAEARGKFFRLLESQSGTSTRGTDKSAEVATK